MKRTVSVDVGPNDRVLVLEPHEFDALDEILRFDVDQNGHPYPGCADARLLRKVDQIR